MRVLVRAAAAADIDAAYLWYEQQRAGLGEEFLLEVQTVRERILRNPETFPVMHRQTRRVLLKRFPYAMYYRLAGDLVIVIACLHGRRDPKRLVTR